MQNASIYASIYRAFFHNKYSSSFHEKGLNNEQLSNLVDIPSPGFIEEIKSKDILYRNSPVLLKQ